MSEHAIPDDYADDVYNRANFTLVRDFGYEGFQRPVEDIDELEATRTVARELFFERDESRAASQQSLKQWREAIERIAKLEAERDRLPANWIEDSSLETWFPLTAEEMVRLKAENARLRAALAMHGAGRHPFSPH